MRIGSGRHTHCMITAGSGNAAHSRAVSVRSAIQRMLRDAPTDKVPATTNDVRETPQS